MAIITLTGCYMGKPENLILTLSMEDDPDSPHYEGDLAVAESRPQLKKPPMYQVVLLNDDYTPMEFVVEQRESYTGHVNRTYTGKRRLWGLYPGYC